MALSIRTSRTRRNSRLKKPGRVVGAIEVLSRVMRLAIAASLREDSLWHLYMWGARPGLCRASQPKRARLRVISRRKRRASSSPLYPRKRSLRRRETTLWAIRRHSKIVHSITSSAMESTPDGTSIPSERAVFTLMTNSNLVGCRTGRSAGLAPFRIRPA
jgi:hypothetical protein